MQTTYVGGGQTVQFGELKAAVLLGTAGPSSYSQTTRDPVTAPAQGDYIAFPMSAVTVSKNYLVQFIPTSVGQLRAGALNIPGAPTVAGWTAQWINNTTTAGTVGNEVTAGVNLSAEQVQFGALVTQL